MSKKILVINCGSSSLKYQLLQMPEGEALVKGNVERIGESVAFMDQKRVSDGKKMKVLAKDLKDGINSHTAAFEQVIKAILDKDNGVLTDVNEIDVVAHRIVQGGARYSDAAIVNEKVLKDIEELCDLAPLHNPAHLEGIKAATAILPNTPQTVTFDTAFHQTMPASSFMYAIPYNLYEKFKLRKYGAHGTSHKYVAQRTAEIVGKPLEQCNMIICHLGNGSSITAIKDGKSYDTSMGLTPLEGLVMGTRCGDIDPTIVYYLCHHGYSVDEVNTILQKKSGLLGLFEKTSDMRDVIEADENGEERGQLALNVWLTRVKKYIGGYFAELGRVDYLVFTGGIGERSFKLRNRICKDLEILGIKFDKAENDKYEGEEGIISAPDSKVKVLVVPTNEELQIAKDAFRITQ
ncbi:MAG: acetate kinase [Spirochaetales bacterium]|nr:acetate kinase [Spirochaetales bacterium]